MTKSATAKELANHFYSICLLEYAQAKTTQEIVTAWRKYNNSLEENGIVPSNGTYLFKDDENEGIRPNNRQTLNR